LRSRETAIDAREEKAAEAGVALAAREKVAASREAALVRRADGLGARERELNERAAALSMQASHLAEEQSADIGARATVEASAAETELRARQFEADAMEQLLLALATDENTAALVRRSPVRDTDSPSLLLPGQLDLVE